MSGVEERVEKVVTQIHTGTMDPAWFALQLTSLTIAELRRLGRAVRVSELPSHVRREDLERLVRTEIDKRP
jgi:hypothetical protein